MSYVRFDINEVSVLSICLSIGLHFHRIWKEYLRWPNYTMTRWHVTTQIFQKDWTWGSPQSPWDRCWRDMIHTAWHCTHRQETVAAHLSPKWGHGDRCFKMQVTVPHEVTALTVGRCTRPVPRGALQEFRYLMKANSIPGNTHTQWPGVYPPITTW